jgi:hypothetical protein
MAYDVGAQAEQQMASVPAICCKKKQNEPMNIHDGKLSSIYLVV